VPTTPVLVAAREIPAKTTLTAADLKLQEYNLDAKPLAALVRAEDAIGKITVQSISIGEPILPTKFADPKGASFVVIPASFIGPDGAPAPNSPNFRAMSITVPDPQAVGGAITAGDIVDLLFTLSFDPATKLQRPNPNQTVDYSAKIILERIPILAKLAASTPSGSTRSLPSGSPTCSPPVVSCRSSCVLRRTSAPVARPVRPSVGSTPRSSS
jgi:Flp pilus assembly protein CpaB